METNSRRPGKMNLGDSLLCLNVADLKASKGFYESLGFRAVEGDVDEGWLTVENSGVRIGLFQGHLRTNLLNFTGGDVAEIARELEARGIHLTSAAATFEDGSTRAETADPDGNVIFFNQFE